MRRPIIAGNWKMHRGPSEAQKLALDIRNRLIGNRLPVDVVLCPPFVSLAVVRDIVRGTDIVVGAQDVFWERDGAFTGEVSAPMLADAGCTYVIIGHSERRQLFGETNDSVCKRVRAALDSGLQAIVAVGETLAERDGRLTENVVATQVREGLAGLAAEDWARLVLAYEPVWAIGTGRNATPEQAQEVHAFLRGVVRDLTSAAVAEQLRIQYGGSVKPANALELLRQPDVDGALVGGASLDASSFVAIVSASVA